MFVGLIPQGDAVKVPVITRNSSTVPTNAASLPTYRVYGPDGFVAGQNGTSAFKDTGTITGATNNGSGLIRIASASHGLTTGARVTITDVGGVTNANSTFVITKIDANSFDLQGSTFAGTYTSGGTWNCTGLYQASITASAANGFEVGEVYTVVFNATVSSNEWAEARTFQVT